MSENMAFDCKQCSQVFEYQYQLISHQICHSNIVQNVNKENESFQCDLCGLLFISPDHLKNHSAQHIQKQPFVCGQCNKSFKTETRYIYHIEDPSLLCITNKCPLCCKIFSCKQCLQRHIKVHTRETKFRCGVCHKPFLTKYKLDRHQKTHSPDHRCNVCSETFPSKLILSGHNRSVHGSDSVFQCSKCPKKYRKRGHMQNHLRSHEDNAVQAENYDFQCSECGKTFRTNGNLIFHERSHNRSGSKFI
ncbi:Zinc finger protein [Pseudolycoriella hygida]|uniref:Zinc finger protein n=1 Tax=Pseudolycoriella hygida TaxID=35572 RepID=A0A9Q0MWH7_9DIPT|nr:Zinc finger protein [Pseudolycoriella hygida]